MSKRVDIDPGDLPEQSLEGRHFQLPDEVAHYVRDVLRMEPGDAVELIDGTGRVLDGRIQSCGERGVLVHVFEDEIRNVGESPCRITIFQCIPKGNRWEWVLEKATELGVTRIVPVESRRTVVTVPDRKLERKMARWERLVRAAARQCQRSRTPEVTAPHSLPDAVGLAADGPRLIPHPGPSNPSLADIVAEFDADSTSSCDLWIGPEGGFTDQEVRILEDAGGQACRLGPRVLRTETAAIAALTIVQSSLGDLSN